MQNICIVGLGIMGGSLALALKEMGNKVEILGCDSSIEHQNDALKLNLVDRIITLEEAKSCDVIFLATPVDTIVALLEKLKDIKSTTTIIDLGSTKYGIVKNTPPQIRSNFVAAHPMCGTEKHGPKAALKGLYRGKIVVICDSENSNKFSLDRAKSIFSNIGMKIVYMDAKEHDKHAAIISHLPHVISFGLANVVLSHEDPKSIVNLAAGGFRDMSRIAKSSPSMWGDIFRQNREFLLGAIESYEDEIKNFKNAIKDGEWDKVSKLIEEANRLEKIL
ncbi:MAG: prephenate dehydrogenase [Campylobacterales bacterium]